MNFNPGSARLSSEEVGLLNAYWRAANYLSVGQIYLFDNPLLSGARYAARVGAGIAFLLGTLGTVLWLRYRKRRNPH